MGWTSEYRKQYLKNWKDQNRDHINAQSLKRYHKIRETDIEKSRRYHRKDHLKRNFGLSLEEYDAMLAAQHGVCAVCQQPETQLRRGKVKNLDVDHCHQTGKIRGLLCSACNAALGLLRDDPLRIKALADYIEKTNAK